MVDDLGEFFIVFGEEGPFSGGIEYHGDEFSDSGSFLFFDLFILILLDL